MLPSGAGWSRGTRAVGSTRSWSVLSPGLAEPPLLPGAPGWEQRAAGGTGGDTPPHREGSVGARALPRAARSKGEGWGQEEKPWHRGHVRAAAPSQGGHPARVPAGAPGSSQVMEEAGAAIRAASLLPLLHAALALATLAQPAPLSASALQCRGSGTQTQAPGCGGDAARCLARARPGSSQPCAKGRCGGAVAADRHSHPPALPQAPASTAGCAITAGLGCSAASPRAQPSPKSN